MFYEGTGPAPSCPVGATLAYDGHSDLQATGAACSCACGAPTGVGCKVDVAMRTTAMCTSAICGTFSVTTTSCADTSACSPAVATTDGLPPVVVGGTCAATLNAVLPPATWSKAVRACVPGLSTGACNSGATCAAGPAAPFSTALCIRHDGDVTCPSGVYASRHLAYGSIKDDRACGGSTCSCGAVTGASCTDAKISEYVTTTCAGNPPTYFQPENACVGLAITMQSLKLSATVTGGTCASSGTATPTGSATPAEPVTFCCAAQ